MCRDLYVDCLYLYNPIRIIKISDVSKNYHERGHKEEVGETTERKPKDSVAKMLSCQCWHPGCDAGLVLQDVVVEGNWVRFHGIHLISNNYM